MGFNNFSYEEEKAFSPLRVGDYKIRIAEAEKMQSKSGNDMLRLVFEISGSKAKIFHYIVDNEYFNSNMSRFYDAFPQINKGDFNTQNWIGKIGACRTKHEEYNGNVNSRVHYFIPASKQAGLAWVEPSDAKPEPSNNGFVDVPEGANGEDLPFK